MCEVGFIDFEYRECGLKYWGDAANDWIRRTVNFEDIELMQYTEMPDKNKTPIYEGDIMEFWAYGKYYRGVVKCYKGNFCIWCHDAAPFLDDAVERHGAVVIGNKWDNPELLKEGSV